MLTHASRRLVLCADDYGLNAGTSRGILELARMRRLSATSCMTTMPGWAADAAELRALDDGALGIGLHLNLTEGAPLGPMPGLAPAGSLPTLRSVLGNVLSRRLDEAEIGREIGRQLDAFADAFGRLPDFVDGHQHVHVLPGIRGPLLQVLAAAGLAGRLWLRDPSDAPGAILQRRLAAPKALLVAALAAGFRSEARRVGFATNEGFSGFSPFDPGRDPADDMRRFLVAPGPRPLVMCHPGLPEPGSADPIAAARSSEHRFLASDGFGELLASARIRLVPGSAEAGQDARLDP